MPQPLALFDLDKTLYDGFSLLDVLDAQAAEKLLAPDVADRFRQTLQDHDDGKLDYETMARQQLELYADSLKGLNYDQVFQSALGFFKQTGNFFGFARPVIELLSQTHQPVLVTALPEPAAKAAAAAIGTVGVHSSLLALDNDQRFSGQVERSLTARSGKQAIVEQLAANHGLANSFGFGDSEGDIAMLQAVNVAICVKPSDGLRQAAHDNDWLIADETTVENIVRRQLQYQKH